MWWPHCRGDLLDTHTCSRVFRSVQSHTRLVRFVSHSRIYCWKEQSHQLYLPRLFQLGHGQGSVQAWAWYEELTLGKKTGLSESNTNSTDGQAWVRLYCEGNKSSDESLLNESSHYHGYKRLHLVLMMSLEPESTQWWLGGEVATWSFWRHTRTTQSQTRLSCPPWQFTTVHKIKEFKPTSGTQISVTTSTYRTSERGRGVDNNIVASHWGGG